MKNTLLEDPHGDSLDFTLKLLLEVRNYAVSRSIHRPVGRMREGFNFIDEPNVSNTWIAQQVKYCHMQPMRSDVKQRCMQ